MPVKEATPFQQALDARVAEGAPELTERLPDNRIRCLACGHRCLILPGLRGICKVRFNREGTLMVPRGYVGALQCDPTEKKPFFHVFPGSDALTFGMLGCDLHCSYCFSGDVRVATTGGMRSFAELWDQGSPDQGGDENKRRPGAFLGAIGDDGAEHEARWIFRHWYRGELVRIAPRLLPAFEATPDHPVLCSENPGPEEPRFIPAGQLTPRHFLAVPRRHHFSQPVTMDTAELLRTQLGLVRVRRHIPVETVGEIVRLTAAGVSSAAIGTRLRLRADHVRHIRSRLVRRGGILGTMVARPEMLVSEDDLVRFGQERRPGIPSRLPLTEDLAELLGYYCAEGCVISAGNRPNSHSLVFAFGLKERDLVERCRLLLKKIFGVTASEITRETTRAVAVGKSSLAVVFEQLCGSGSARKRIPAALLKAERSVAEAFLRAYVAGDGHRYLNGKVSVTTVSEQLAWDVAWLVLRLGYLPGLYKAERQIASLARMAPSAPRAWAGGHGCGSSRSLRQVILGRSIKAQPQQYSVVWYEKPVPRVLNRQDERFYYVPIREVTRRPYEGHVYNLETADRHTYMANYVAVHNCQNWVTSQALRDPGALAEPMDCTPRQLVDIAQRYGARLVATSYNEPLITSEWAVDVFKEAKRRGFTTAYISNGNATREVLEYIRPWTDCYKIDLKSMRDKNYRALGGKLENIVSGVRMVYEMGFWMEIVTLTIPGFNDSDEELRDAATFLAGISPDIPWHVTAFHKDYKMTDPDNTTPEILLRAAAIGEAAGLHHVYAGNLPGRVQRFEDTRCPRCKTTLIHRYGYRILEDRLSGRGTCFKCQERIPGVWQ